MGLTKEYYENSVCFKCPANDTKEWRENKPVYCKIKGSIPVRMYRCSDYWWAKKKFGKFGH